MAKIIEILKEFLKDIEKENRFNLVVKGGTALSLYHLNNHRESEDLDFDADRKYLDKHKEILGFFKEILEGLRKKRVIEGYKIMKSGFASTKRYHIKLEIKTYKTIYTKIDIDFVDLPKDVSKRGNLLLYSLERMFVSKIITYANRKEFKDLYDLYYLIDKVDCLKFKKGIVDEIENVVDIIGKEDMLKMYKLAFRNVDLRFKNLKEKDVEKFTKKVASKLKILINKIKGDKGE